MINWAEIRKRFPVADSSTYLNTAAAGPLARATMEAACEYYTNMMTDGDIHWDHWLAQREIVRQKVAKFINAEPDEVGLTTNTSSGMNLLVDALEGRGEVISCDLEFPVSTIPWMHRRIPVHRIKSVEGIVNFDDIKRSMSSKTGVLSFSHVQFSNGFRIDLEQLGREKGNHFLVVNASQSAGAFEIDVKRMKIDALCATGHKWMLAGYGSGFVYLSRELLEQSRQRTIGWLSVEEPYADRNAEVRLRKDASSRAELGCPHFAGIFALGTSVDLLSQIGIRNIEQRALSLNRVLTDRLREVGWKVLSPLSFDGYRSAETLVATDNPSKVVARLASQRIFVTEKPEGIRVSTDFFNSEEDIDRLVRAIHEIPRSETTKMH